jgi:hypothetical protein
MSSRSSNSDGFYLVLTFKCCDSKWELPYCTRKLKFHCVLKSMCDWVVVPLACFLVEPPFLLRGQLTDLTLWQMCSLKKNFFLVVLEFELRASHLWGRHYTAWDAPPNFCSGYFGDGVSLFDQAGLDCDHSILSFLPLLGWHHTPPFLLIEIGSQELFAHTCLEPWSFWWQPPK